MHNNPKDYGNTKPPAGSKVDWGHPISQRMWCAYLFNEKGGTKVYDACDRAGVMSFVSVTAMPLWTALGLQCGNSKGYVENNATVKSALNPVAADFTVRIRHVPRAWPGTYTTPFDEVNRYMSIFMNGSTITYSGGGGRGGACVMPVNELTDFVWVRRLRGGTGTHFYYRNSKLTSSESGDTGVTWNTTGHRIAIGGNPSGGGGRYDGCYHLVEVWMRALQVPEIEELWEDPYVNIDTGKLKLWSVPKSGIAANAQSFTAVTVSAPSASVVPAGVHNFTFISGFDHISSTAEITSLLNFTYTTGFVLNTNTTHTPFNTGQSLSASSNGNLTYAFPAATAKTIVGFYFKPTALSGSLIQLFDSGSNQLWVGFQAGNTGYLEIRRGTSNGTLLGTTAGQVLTNNTFYHIEFKSRISDSISSGDVVLYVDGTSVLTLSAGTDTQSTANTQIDSVSIGKDSMAGYIDDVFFVDWTIGSSAQVGKSRVQTFVPNGAGATNDFTASGGGGSGTNYNMVDEIPGSSSDYTSSPTASAVDLYDMNGFTSIPTAVRTVQISSMVANTDCNQRIIRGILRIGSTNYEGSNMVVMPTYRYLPTLYLGNPASNVAWAAGDIAGLQAGLKIQS